MDFIEANGVGLRCELSGGGERTLVLVHEMGGSLESCRRDRVATASVRTTAHRVEFGRRPVTQDGCHRGA